MGTEVVLNVASQFAVLEQLQGWSTGTGELNPEQASAPAEGEAPTPSPAPQKGVPEPIPAAEEAPDPIPAPEAAPAPEVAPDPVPAPEPAAAPGSAEGLQAEALPETSEPVGTTTIPPFTLPRERTPTGELEGPRLNTSELQNALRASAPTDETAAQADNQESTLQEAVEPMAAAEDLIEEVATQAPAPEVSLEPPAAEIIPDPMDETLVSSSSKDPEAPVEAAESIEDAVAPSTEENIAAFHVDEPVSEPESPVEQQPATEAELETPSSPAEPDSVVKEQESAKIPELAADDQEPEFPRAQTETEDVPSWIEGITGITDPNILEDFDFEPEQQEAEFPAAQNGEIADDDSMFKQRVIPEAMNAKLNTPTDLPKTNGNQEHVPPQHDGPITIQAAQADTQMFRNVLKGLSGTEVLSGDYEKPPEEPAKKNGDSVADSERGLDKLLAAEDGLDELRSAVREAPAPEVPIEDPPAEAAPPPSAGELRQVQEPEPEPVHAQPANWPPTLPTEDDDWDDELDVSA
jgi:hypothetical protein